jgi:hypothetical protein
VKVLFVALYGEEEEDGDSVAEEVAMMEDEGKISSGFATPEKVMKMIVMTMMNGT